MSTRCQIEFRTTLGGGKTERRTVYRHSDGYPDGQHGVIETLKEFLAWDGRAGDVEYQTANFIYWSKKRAVDTYGEGSAQLGFGVCENDEFHPDVEYYYIVDYRVADRGIRLTVHDIHSGQLGKLIFSEDVTLR